MELPHFFGHTHLQGGFYAARMARLRAIPRPSVPLSEVRIVLEPGAAYLINAGAVGQPRDGDPRAAYALFDSEAREAVLRRVAYDHRWRQSERSRRRGCLTKTGACSGWHLDDDVL